MPVLNNLSRRSYGSPAAAHRVLVDGMWYNPNYWFRYALCRRALMSSETEEVGLIGQFARDQQRECFDLMGISRVIDFRSRFHADRFLAQGHDLVTAARAPDDLMAWELPHGFPPSLLFDGILKRQRRGTVNLEDPLLPETVAEALGYIEAADEIVAEGEFDLVCLSHALDYTYTSLAWAAMRRDIPVVVLYGDYGTSRFIRMDKGEDLFAYPGRPTADEIDEMPLELQDALRRVGGEYIGKRLSGSTQDVGVVYAYQRRMTSVDHASLVERYAWDGDKPIIGVYGSNWFDYPHCTGFEAFRDFRDWVEFTLDVARERTDINWLFKSHPCDDWYASIRGARIEDLVRATDRPHIKAADKTWNGADLINCLDGIITCHGTVGLEGASVGKPILVAHRGWYGHAGFSATATTRDSYRIFLLSDWWSSHDIEKARNRAQLFAGWYFAVPNWHGSYVFRDDSDQEMIFETFEGFIENNSEAIDRETAELRCWFDSGHKYFHIFKLARADGFQSTYS